MTTTGTLAGEPLVVEPCRRAWRHMKAALFPFRLDRWLILGFVAWLTMLGQGGGGAGLNLSQRYGGKGGPSIQQMVGEACAFVEAHLALLLALGAVGLLFGIAIGAVLAYFSSRGTFMYLDCIHRQQTELGPAWRRAGLHTWSFFCWRLALGLTNGFVAFGLTTTAIVLTWQNIRTVTFTGSAIVTYVVIGIILFLVSFVLGMFSWLLRNLVAPIMYLTHCTGSQGWRELFSLISRAPGAFILYWLMNVALSLLAAAIALPVVCCSCCLLGLPVIHQTVLQPVYYWLRAYPFHFLAQFDARYPAPGTAQYSGPSSLD
jgi:hypothetical protein